jgi:hypothetical protein
MRMHAIKGLAHMSDILTAWRMLAHTELRY